MKIAVLGGSFDPPHNGHMAIADKLLSLDLFDRIMLMPLLQHPFGKKLLSPSKRLKMTRLLKKDRVEVSDLEIKRKAISYTIDTLLDLADKQSQNEFYWIIGEDQIENLTRWKDWKRLVDKFKLIVIPRAESKKTKKELKNIKKLISYPENIILIDKEKFPPIRTSSTMIRKRVKEGKSISKLVPKKIEEYIIQHKLYL